MPRGCDSSAIGDDGAHACCVCRSVQRGALTQFDFNFERKEVYECGAALLAVVACARAVDDEKSSELYRSLCGHALWRRYLKSPDDWTPITVRPQYVFRDRKLIDQHVAYERMVAGRMAIAFFKQAELGQLPKGIQRLSVNQMAGSCLTTLNRRIRATSSEGSGRQAARSFTSPRPPRLLGSV